MLCKNGNSISVIQWVWDYPQNIKTERFGSQPERSVFPVWVLLPCAQAVRNEKRGYMAYRRLGCRARCAAAFDELRRYAAVER